MGGVLVREAGILGEGSLEDLDEGKPAREYCSDGYREKAGEREGWEQHAQYTIRG